MVNDHLTTCFRHAECAKLGNGSALSAARIRAARIGALLLDLAVALPDSDRAHAADGLLQDSALGGGGLARESSSPLHRSPLS